MTAQSEIIRDTRTLILYVLGGSLFLLLLPQSAGLAAAVIILVGFAGLMLRWPNVGTLVVLFAIYSNIGVLAMRSQNTIKASAGSAAQNPRIAVVLAALALLLAVPLVYQIVVRRGKVEFDRGFALMSAYLAVLLASSFFARDQQIFHFEIADYLLEGLGLYFLVTNVIRDLTTLRRAIWALLLAGSLMSGLTVFQKISHTESRIYGGMAQVDTGKEPSVRQILREGTNRITEQGLTRGEVRAAGPIGEPNRYAQVLVVLLPLAVLQFRTARSPKWRALALITAALILGGMCLTFSRGALLTGAIVFAMMAATGLLNAKHILISAMAITLFVVFVDPEVATRLASLERLKVLISQTHSASETLDSSAIRRYEENVAAWHVFMDHPILGVGPGHFAAFYSNPYSNRIGLIQQTKGYRGHNLYLETLAETGLIGLLSLLAIVFVVMRALWREHELLAQRCPELDYMAIGFLLSLAAYAVSAVFAHLSYQRYFWLLVAVSSAAVRIIHQASQERPWRDLALRPNETD
jgi:putative inorganic carbon (hco3(-)) transporter